MFTKIILICLLCVSSLLAIAASPKLVYAVDLIRHGDRAPQATIPAAPARWPYGIGELTPIGMNQEFRLGQSMRNFYVSQTHLLPPHYQATTMQVRSTGFNRTIMSAQCLLQGLYPSGTGPYYQQGKRGLPASLQVIPVHSRPKNDDDVFLPKLKRKGQYQALLKKTVYNQPTWRAKQKAVKKQLARWSALTGVELTTLADIITLGDTLYVRRVHHIMPPEGLTQADITHIIKLENWARKQLFLSQAVTQFSAGKLLKVLTTQFRHHERTPAASPKWRLYSAHDTNVAAVLAVLGYHFDKNPPYASDVRFLLYKQGKQNILKVELNGKLLPIAASRLSEQLRKY